MATSGYARVWLFWGLIVLVLLGLGSCLGARASPTGEPTLTPSQYPPCDSAEFDLSEGILQNAEQIDISEWVDRQLLGRREQLGWLDVRLELPQQSVAYGAPVPFRLTITNVQEHPVIFVRPVYATFLGASAFISPYPFHLFWDIVSSSGERLDPYGDTGLPQMGFPPRTVEMFAVLPPGESCTVEAQVDWEQIYLPPDEPLAPGTYRVSVVLRGSDLGPTTESYEHLDIGAWVGSNGSNPVTLTIRPPEQ